MLDEMDRQLILELQDDGRESYAHLGKVLGVTEGTVRKRLKNLRKRNIIDIVAVPRMSKLGYNFVSILGIQVQMEDLSKVAEQLAEKQAICLVAFVTGRYDLIAVVVNRSTEEFSDFMLHELSVIPSIVRTETFVTISVLKGAVELAETASLVRDCDITSLKKSKR